MKSYTEQLKSTKKASNGKASRGNKIDKHGQIKFLGKYLARDMEQKVPQYLLSASNLF